MPGLPGLTQSSRIFTIDHIDRTLLWRKMKVSDRLRQESVVVCRLESAGRAALVGKLEIFYIINVVNRDNGAF